MRTDIETLGGVSAWLTPVKTKADLPTKNVREHSYCYVEDIAEVMVFQHGTWDLAQAQGMPDQNEL